MAKHRASWHWEPPQRLHGTSLGGCSELPRVRVSLHSGNTSEIVVLLLEEKISFGLIEGPTRDRGVRTERFMEGELVLITPLHFESDRWSTRELAASTLLLRELGSGSRRVVESALEKAGLKLKSFRRLMELDSTEAIKSAVEVGLGVGFVSRWAIAKELDLGVLKSIPVDRIRVTRHFTLISRCGPHDCFRISPRSLFQPLVPADKFNSSPIRITARTAATLLPHTVFVSKELQRGNS